tara:strand:- start:1126 stop:1497 length:372 start_codon:yes stop_codon:yes gene_type:complete
MRFPFNRVTYELEDKANPYYRLLLDFIGNKINPLFNYIELYEASGKKSLLNSFLGLADERHNLFDEMLDQIIAIMNKEGLTGKPHKLINILKKASDFDWKDMNKFKKFGNVYTRILKNLKKLS